MKKLNRKGFTLIELLAVIVVLAIIIVVTIPSVISSMNSAKSSQLNNAVGTVTEWFTKQYELDTLGTGVGGGPSTEYTTFKNTFTDKALPITDPGSDNVTGDAGQTILKAAGITNPTGLTGRIYVNGSKICVILNAGTDSQFNVAGTDNKAIGSGCPTE